MRTKRGSAQHRLKHGRQNMLFAFGFMVAGQSGASFMRSSDVRAFMQIAESGVREPDLGPQ